MEILGHGHLDLYEWLSLRQILMNLVLSDHFTRNGLKYLHWFIASPGWDLWSDVVGPDVWTSGADIPSDNADVNNPSRNSLFWGWSDGLLSGEKQLIMVSPVHMGPVEVELQGSDRGVGGGGVLSGKVGTGMCSPDRVHFSPTGFSMTPFYFKTRF